ncbi:MAG: hypothetical protein EXQ91_08975 [Alphaproteobacteria bacterium]|nr:hypothetical protein [Alphaproteobacteria bacterium]
MTNAIDDRDEIHVVTNSDEVLQTNLDLEGHLPNFLGHGPLEVAKVATWVGEHADALHRWLFVNFAIRIHADELDPEREAASASAERLTHDIIARVPAG